jgi:glycosyltransferase involved in cell wall biosynthesis
MARLIFITQSFDENDPVLATTVSWVNSMAAESRIASIHVIALRSGPYPPIRKVTVSAIRARTKIGTMYRFYKEVIPRLRATDAFFVHMGGPYPLWLLPFRLFFGIPIYQWKTHRHVGLMMEFYARICDTKVFTATRQSFPYFLSHVSVLGHGIDTDFFVIPESLPFEGVISVGRIASVKRLDVALSALAECHKAGLVLSLHIYGPIARKDGKYREQLARSAGDSGIAESVFFHGPVRQRLLPAIIGRHRVMVSCNDGGLDKAVLEAMACGVPVVTDNPCVLEILPPEMRFYCIVPRGDAAAYAAALSRIMGMDAGSYCALGAALRSIVVRDHSLRSLTRGLMREMAL